MLDLRLNLQSVDRVVAQKVEALQLVQQARFSVMSRELSKLKADYGTADPLVRDAEAAVAGLNVDIAQLSVLNRRLKTPNPQVSPDAWALHGRVFDAQLRPIARYTVFLVDAEKVYQRAYGFSYTDETGYFLLTVKAQNGEEPTTLFVQIANDRSQPVYLSAEAVRPHSGDITYVDIVLGLEGEPIGNPPKAIRDVSVPINGSNS